MTHRAVEGREGVRHGVGRVQAREGAGEAGEIRHRVPAVAEQGRIEGGETRTGAGIGPPEGGARRIAAGNLADGRMEGPGSRRRPARASARRAGAAGASRRRNVRQAPRPTPNAASPAASARQGEAGAGGGPASTAAVRPPMMRAGISASRITRALVSNHGMVMAESVIGSGTPGRTSQR